MQEAFIEIAKAVNHFGIGAALMLVIVEYMRPEKRSEGYLACNLSYILLIAISLVSILTRFIFYPPQSEPDPRVFYLFFTSVFLIGPLILFQASSMTNYLVYGREKRRLHLVPVALSFVAETLYQGGYSFAKKQQMMSEAFQRAGLQNLIDTAILLAFLHVSIYFLFLLYRIFSTLREYDLRYIRFIMAILIVPFFGAVMTAAGYFSLNNLLYHTGLILISLTVSLFFIIPARYSRFFDSLIADIEQKKYEKSILHNLDLELVRARLGELMTRNKLFLDENLKLQDLADELMISTHQLSRLLNEHYGKSFNDFVNSYRVEEAKKLLLSEPDLPILHIAFQSGFSTKATFNAQFSKFAGLTPSSYRKEHGV